LITPKDLIHLLNSQAFGFRNTEVHPDNEDEAEDQEEVEGAEGDGFEHAGRYKSDNKLEGVSWFRRMERRRKGDAHL
jgi:hypothetical protein